MARGVPGATASPSHELNSTAFSVSPTVRFIHASADPTDPTLTRGTGHPVYFNNLSHYEAAQLVGKIRPKSAIPCHYDMFPDNAVDPKQFRASLKLRAPEVAYQELEHGRVFVFAV